MGVKFHDSYINHEITKKLTHENNPLYSMMHIHTCTCKCYRLVPGNKTNTNIQCVARLDTYMYDTCIQERKEHYTGVWEVVGSVENNISGYKCHRYDYLTKH